MIAITGAAGQLGRLVIEDLLAAGVPAGDIVAVVRTPAKVADLAEKGVVVREADYEQPAALTAALTGVDTLLLVSGSDFGRRIPQHTNVIDAAKAAGVGRVAYTSILHADTTQVSLAVDHKATEEVILASGLPYTFLRNGWYYETAFGDVADSVARGALVGASGDGRVAYATRSDFAAAAVAVLTGTGHENRIYELGGDRSLTMTEIAEAISEASGRTVVYQDLGADGYAGMLGSVGLPAPVVEMLADIQAGNRRGELEVTSGDLEKLIGRPSTPAVDYFRSALNA
ncbi:NAD(P)H dehydrogenase (quinone) [Nakamurella sp. UYEF19]|uniref:SDR family oxidoreductase n=1 Tax=Nakamurella sp. UYEF19 TaxID=1756392 RepID=UPI00339561E3